MILLVGDLDRDEFRALRPILEACAPCLLAETPEQALDVVQAACKESQAGQAEPLWIVLALAYPGQFAAEGVNRLRRLVPLAPVVVVEGPWSAGQWRSGRPLAGVHRVSWLEFPRKAREQWNRFCCGEAARAQWMLPATASEEERILTAAQTPLPRAHGQAVICTPTFASYQWIAAICRYGGLATVWYRPAEHLRLDGDWVAVFDADGWACGESPWPQLRHLAARVRGAPTVVLMGQPRPEDCRRAQAAGATAVLNKPVPIEDLLAALAPRAAAPSTTPGRARLRRAPRS